MDRLFSRGEAAVVSGLSPRIIESWNTKGFHASCGVSAGPGHLSLYSFADVVAIRAARELKEAGISAPGIHLALGFIQTTSIASCRNRWLMVSASGVRIGSRGNAREGETLLNIGRVIKEAEEAAQRCPPMRKGGARQGSGRPRIAA